MHIKVDDRLLSLRYDEGPLDWCASYAFSTWAIAFAAFFNFFGLAFEIPVHGLNLL